MNRNRSLVLVLTASTPWVSLEVVEDEDEPDRASLLFVPYEHVRRVVFRPTADRPEQLGFRLHEPGTLDPAEAAPSQRRSRSSSTEMPAC